MAKLTADQAAAKWAANLAGSTARVQAGIQAVTTAPGQGAARQKAVWAQNVAAAQDKWATRVAAVPLSDWQAAAITKGVPRIAGGATAAQPKMQQFYAQLLPYINSGVSSLPARGSLDQNINRLTAWVRYMSSFQKR